jgi:hypothetical protein
LSEFHNYFNYFTEIEEHFQRARGTSLFLLSPLDWALVESWKNSGVPLEAVLRGIDSAFEKWRAKRTRTQMVNSLAFCAQAVLTEAQRTPASEPDEPVPPPFERSEIDAFLSANRDTLSKVAGFEEVAQALGELVAREGADLEELEQRLTVLEQKMIAIARAGESDEESLNSRRELEEQLQPYRRKMSGPQLAMLERQFLERRLLQNKGLPRLSLFYLR